MSDLSSEVHRMMMLNGLRDAHPSLLREVFSENPNQERIVTGLREHNDKLHDNLRRVSEPAPERDTTSNVEAPEPRDAQRQRRVTEIFRNGLK
jgi:hypothetical protein